MAPPPRRSRRLALKRVAIGDLPEPALRRILLGHSDSLLRFVAACARVCAEWWRVVRGSAAYGLALPRERREDAAYAEGDDDERARVLKAIVRALDGQVELNLCRQRIGDAGAAALGAELQAMPRVLWRDLDLDGNDLTAAGIISLVPALRRPWGSGLTFLRVADNPLGDAGVAALAKALPPTLEQLDVDTTGCGDDGLVALAAALPALTRLQTLDCARNPDAGARGWVALAGALPSMPAFKQLFATSCTGMGSEGAAALVAAVPQCSRLCCLIVQLCGLGAEAETALSALGHDAARSQHLAPGLTIFAYPQEMS
eukprot:COSAG04_NODE_2901_length_3403_cov_2.324455_2_plen_315_part_00